MLISIHQYPKAGQRDEYAEAELKEIKKQIELADSVVRELRTRLHELVNTKIGNIIHWSVPISQNEVQFFFKHRSSDSFSDLRLPY